MNSTFHDSITPADPAAVSRITPLLVAGALAYASVPGTAVAESQPKLTEMLKTALAASD